MEFIKHSLFNSLSLQRLRLKVKLGCSPEERKLSQWVSFDVQVRFDSLPQGCTSDSIEDTVCYAQLSDQIRTVCEKGEYSLIEKLGWDSYSSLKESLPQTTQLWLRVTKEKPPVAELEGGASFTLGDWSQV